MTLQEKLISKLQPHADRIQNGNNDEFDYLPAVLLHLIEDQKLQSKTTAEFINQAKDDAKNGMDEISVRLAELKTIIAMENQKTRRLLLAGLFFGVVTLVIATLLYVRH